MKSSTAQRSTMRRGLPLIYADRNPKQQFDIANRLGVTDSTFPNCSAPTLRPTTPNTSLAFDLMPNGVPAGQANAAWLDIVDTDIRDSPLVGANCAFLHLGAGTTAGGWVQIGSKNLGTAAAKEIRITQQATIDSSDHYMIRISTITGGYTTADDQTLTHDPWIVIGAAGGSIVLSDAFRKPANATMGFVYLPVINGTPTGTPTSYGKSAAFVADYTADQLWFYGQSSSTWRRLRPSEEAWTAATTLNSWVNVGAGFNTPAYRKDSSGYIHLKGAIKSGTMTAGTVLLTLPAGYRPGGSCIFPGINSGNAVAELRVDTAGNVTLGVTVAANTYLSLDAIQFLAEN